MDSWGRLAYAHPMDKERNNPLSFMKMHGLGNDFVVVDGRTVPVRLDAATVVAMADRHRGVGFDQLAVITVDDTADAALTFYNADGSTSAACGNATRCVARFLMDETGRDAVNLRTGHDVLEARDVGGGLTTVNMGSARTEWQEIPLSGDCDTLSLPIDGAPVATNMGNPHCTFFVEDAKAADLATIGPDIEHHPLFPERTNVQVAHLCAPDALRMRVWERGVGITLASGSSSCAVAVAAHRRGLVGDTVTIHLDGGPIAVRITPGGVWMTGPTAHVFNGVWLG